MKFSAVRILVFVARAAGLRAGPLKQRRQHVALRFDETRLIGFLRVQRQDIPPAKGFELRQTFDYNSGSKPRARTRVSLQIPFDA